MKLRDKTYHLPYSQSQTSIWAPQIRAEIHSALAPASKFYCSNVRVSVEV